MFTQSADSVMPMLSPERDSGCPASGGGGTFHFSASEEIPTDYSFDYCLITSKSHQTRELCERHSHILAGMSCASLQNGIGNEEIIAEYTDKVIGGTIITGFEWRGDARVVVTVEAGPVRFGRFPQGMDPEVSKLVDLFKQAGLNVEGSEQIRSNLWAKTLYNCALNPLGRSWMYLTESWPMRTLGALLSRSLKRPLQSVTLNRSACPGIPQAPTSLTSKQLSSPQPQTIIHPCCRISEAAGRPRSDS